MYTFLLEDGQLIKPHLNHVLNSFYNTTNISAFAIDSECHIIDISCREEVQEILTSVINQYIDVSLFNKYQDLESNDSLVLELSEHICIIIYPVYHLNEPLLYLVTEPFCLDSERPTPSYSKLVTSNTPIVSKRQLPYLGQLFRHLSSKSIYCGRHHFIPSKKMEETTWAKDLETVADLAQNEMFSISTIEKITDFLVEHQLKKAKSVLISMQTMQSQPHNKSCPTSFVRYQNIALLTLLRYCLSKRQPLLEIDLIKCSNKLMRKNDTYRSLSQLTSLSYEILDDFDQVITMHTNIDIPPNIKLAIDYIHINYQSEVRLSEVAESIPMNESYLSSQFKQFVGKTFKNYLNEYRIKQSIILIKQHHFSLTEIASLVGFDSISYFSTVFKKHTGYTPSKYNDNK